MILEKEINVKEKINRTQIVRITWIDRILCCLSSAEVYSQATYTITAE